MHTNRVDCRPNSQPFWAVPTLFHYSAENLPPAAYFVTDVTTEVLSVASWPLERDLFELRGHGGTPVSWQSRDPATSTCGMVSARIPGADQSTQGGNQRLKIVMNG